MDDYTRALIAEARHLSERAKENGDPIGAIQFAELADALAERAQLVDNSPTLPVELS